MSGRLRAALITGMVAAVTFTVVTFYVNGWPGSASPAIYLITPTLVLLAYLIVGLIAWQVHPGQRIGLLFTVTGYAWFLPTLTQLHYPLPYTIGNLTWSLYEASLAHLALAWPSGRLRSRLDRAVVAGIYAWTIGSSAIVMLFWDSANGCGAACPANVLMVDGNNRLHDMLATLSSVVGIGIVALVLVLVAWHWWRATGYARRAMTRLLWFTVPTAAYICVLGYPLSNHFSALVLYGIGPLILVTGPAAYGIGLLRARTARGAVGAVLTDLEPGPSPGQLRDALAKALGDPSLQLAFRAGGPAGYADTSGQLVDSGRLPPGRMLTTLDAAGDAVLIYDAELRYEPELVRVTTAAASLALEHARLQSEIEEQLRQVRASRARIVRGRRHRAAPTRT